MRNLPFPIRPNLHGNRRPKFRAAPCARRSSTEEDAPLRRDPPFCTWLGVPSSIRSTGCPSRSASWFSILITSSSDRGMASSNAARRSISDASPAVSSAVEPNSGLARMTPAAWLGSCARSAAMTASRVPPQGRHYPVDWPHHHPLMRLAVLHRPFADVIGRGSSAAGQGLYQRRPDRSGLDKATRR